VLLVDIHGSVITFLNSIEDGTDQSFTDLLSNQPDQTPVERLWNKMSIDFPGTFLSLLLCYLLHLLLFVILCQRSILNNKVSETLGLTAKCPFTLNAPGFLF
jgi:hypothetical protein